MREPTTLRFECRPHVNTLSMALAVCEPLAREVVPASWIHHAFGVMVLEPPPKDVLYMKTFDSTFERRQFSKTYQYYDRSLIFFDGRVLALADYAFPYLKTPAITWACPDVREDALFWLAEHNRDGEPPITHYGIETFPRLGS